MSFVRVWGVGDAGVVVAAAVVDAGGEHPCRIVRSYGVLAFALHHHLRKFLKITTGSTSRIDITLRYIGCYL